MLFGEPIFRIWGPGLSLDSLLSQTPANEYPERQQELAEVLGSLPHMGNPECIPKVNQQVDDTSPSFPTW